MWPLEEHEPREEIWKLIQEEACGTEIKQKLQNLKFESVYFSYLFLLDFDKCFHFLAVLGNGDIICLPVSLMLQVGCF